MLWLLSGLVWLLFGVLEGLDDPYPGLHLFLRGGGEVVDTNVFLVGAFATMDLKHVGLSSSAEGERERRKRRRGRGVGGKGGRRERRRERRKRESRKDLK